MIILRNLVTNIVKTNKSVASFVFFSTTRIAKEKEEKIKVGKYNINYLKVGNGSHSVLCMPGALGSIWTDFKPQIEGFDREKFTLIAWDPPGYGKSRPPERQFPVDFYEKDADAALEFMKVLVINNLSLYPKQALNVTKFSLLGWSDGGISSMILAAKYPDAVNKVVVWGANSFILPHELESYKKIKDVSSWSEKMRKPMVDLYGAERFPKLWAEWIDAMIAVYNANDGNICSEVLKKVSCPTFILYGEKDPLVDNVHVSHLHTHIQGSKIYLYPEGKHNIHIRYAEDFNQKVQEFLLQG